MEIRDQVTDYVKEKIAGLRQLHIETGAFGNIAVIRANAMKFLPNFFHKSQVSAVSTRANTLAKQDVFLLS